MPTVRKQWRSAGNASRTMEDHRMFDEKPNKLLFLVEARLAINVIL
jgi:hypothetical protein